jgi:CelD/BcsL family acetyltransferase involved in cellulose biosynthesis
MTFTSNNPFVLIRKTDWNDILKPEFLIAWESFFEGTNTNHVFFHPALSVAWIKTYRKLREITPLFYIIEGKDKKIMFPFIIWKKNWKHAYQVVIGPLGFGDFDYSDPILIGKFTKDELIIILQTVISDIKKNFKYDLINISGQHLNEFDKVGPINVIDKIHLIDLKEFKGFDQFVQKLTSKQQKELKRRYTRLCESGKLEVSHYSDVDIDLASSELEQMLDVHTARWPNAYKAKGYHEHLLKNGLKSGIIHFSTIKINGYTISWRLGFILNKHYYSYMPAYRPEFKKYSPGILHLLVCIKYAIESKCEVYDLLRGSEKYKQDWHTVEGQIVGITLGNHSPASILRNKFNIAKQKILSPFNYLL